MFMFQGLSNSSRCLRELEKQLNHRKHIILHGNIFDRFFYHGKYCSIHEIINNYLKENHFEIVMSYEPASSFKFYDDDMRLIFSSLVTENRNSENEQRDSQNTKNHPTIRLKQALPRLHAALSQDERSVAVLLNLGEMLIDNSDKYDEDERTQLVRLKKCILESSILQTGKLKEYRNTVIILSSDLGRVPEWLYQNNPLIETINVTTLDLKERKDFFYRIYEAFTMRVKSLLVDKKG